jgi:hypothetical protein
LLAAAGDYPVRVEASNGVLPDNGVDGIVSVTEAAVVPLPPTLPALDGAVNAPTTAAPGTTATLTGSGYAPWAPLEIGIYSLPTVLGTIFADSTGAFSLTVTLPSFTGSHTLVVAGIGADGDPLYIGSAITLAAQGNLAHSGDDTSAPLLLFALLLLTVGAAVRTRARFIGRR